MWLLLLMVLAYPDHVLADSHQLVVQFRINHLHLLQLEDPLVAALSQLTLVLLQTLDDLERWRETLLIVSKNKCDAFMLERSSVSKLTQSSCVYSLNCDGTKVTLHHLDSLYIPQNAIRSLHRHHHVNHSTRYFNTWVIFQWLYLNTDFCLLFSQTFFFAGCTDRICTKFSFWGELFLLRSRLSKHRGQVVNKIQWWTAWSRNFCFLNWHGNVSQW